ncbi:MAG: hypothetical protein IPM16_08440 [Chloroflexi bacterium]|nr:hypothetical protein [Chloroflexota bacterium]
MIPRNVIARATVGAAIAALALLSASAQDAADYGDAPESYAAAVHLDAGSEWLGPPGEPAISAETERCPVDADLFDDGLSEDGTITISAGPDAPIGERQISAWVDLNDDGDWDDRNEWVVRRVLLWMKPNGSRTLSAPSLAEAYGKHWIRVTLIRVADPTTTSSDGTILANIGETEDYAPFDYEADVTDGDAVEGCASPAIQP